MTIVTIFEIISIGTIIYNQNLIFKTKGNLYEQTICNRRIWLSYTHTSYITIGKKVGILPRGLVEDGQA